MKKAKYFTEFVWLDDCGLSICKIGGVFLENFYCGFDKAKLKLK